MNPLPNAHKAVVPLEKFTEYPLNPEHPTGRHKARVFQAALGLTQEHAGWRRDLVAGVALTHDAELEADSAYGSR